MSGTHLVLLYGRRADLDRESFLRHWEHRHAPLVARLPGVRRYVRNVVLRTAGGPAPWDGVDELWVDDLSAAEALLQDGRLLASESGFTDPASIVRLRTTDHVVVAGPPMGRTAVFPQRMAFVKRRHGTSRAELLRYWRKSHGPLAALAPGLRRFVQSAVLEGDDAPFDGVAQVWMEDEAALNALLRSSFLRERVKPDAARFTEASLTRRLSVREHRIVWSSAD